MNKMTVVPNQVIVTPDHQYPPLVDVAITFTCPHCGKVQEIIESAHSPLFGKVYWRVDCGGEVIAVMPWRGAHD